MQNRKGFWIAMAAFQVAYGLAVFGVTRYVHLSGVGSSTNANPSAQKQTPVSDVRDLEVSPQILESLLGPLNGPADAQAVSLLANEYFANENYVKAAEMYERLLAFDPENPDVINNLGLTLHYVGRSMEAVEILNNGASLALDNQRLHLTLGFVNRDIGNTEEARLALEKVVRLDPSSAVGESAKRMLAEM